MIYKEINFKFKIKKHLNNEISSKLFYVDSLIIKSKIINQSKILIFFKSNISSIKFNKIKKNVNKLINKLNLKPLEPKKNILHINKYKKFINSKDLRKVLIKNREIFKGGDGIYSLGNKLTKLNNFFDNKIKSIANKYKAQEYSFPSLISSNKLEKVGYFDNFPQSCCFAGHIKEDYNIIDGFKLADRNINKKISVKASLSPTVCHHLYFLLENTKIDKNFVATAKSNCFRYETKNMDSLERTWNFNMREIVLIGDQKFVLKEFSKIQKKIINLLDTLKISYIIESANDPFFEGNFKDLISYQNAFKLKYEVRADTPYNNSSIAIGSFNNSQNIFGKKMNIKLNNEFIHSACIGFGFERFAYCFVSQHGLNIDKWPDIVKNNLK